MKVEVFLDFNWILGKFLQNRDANSSSELIMLEYFILMEIHFSPFLGKSLAALAFINLNILNSFPLEINSGFVLLIQMLKHFLPYHLIILGFRLFVIDELVFFRSAYLILPYLLIH